MYHKVTNVMFLISIIILLTLGILKVDAIGNNYATVNKKEVLNGPPAQFKNTPNILAVEKQINTF